MLRVRAATASLSAGAEAAIGLVSSDGAAIGALAALAGEGATSWVVGSAVALAGAAAESVAGPAGALQPSERAVESHGAMAWRRAADGLDIRRDVQRWSCAAKSGRYALAPAGAAF